MISQLLPAALLYLQARLFSIPLNSERKPLFKWKAYEEGPLPTTEQVTEWFSKPDAVGLANICGAASEGLLAIDFDLKNSPNNPQLYQNFILRLIINRFPVEVLDRIPVIATKSGGRHWYVRVDQPGQNRRLAQNADGAPVIETRATGGIVFAPPTEGYSFISGGGINEIPFLSVNEIAILFSTAAEFNLKKPAAVAANNRPRYFTKIPYGASVEQVFEACGQYVSNYQHYAKGNRNHFLYTLSRRLKKKNVQEGDAITLCVARFTDTDFTQKEITDTVKSAYKRP